MAQPNATEGDTSTGTESTEKPLTLDALKAFLGEELPKQINAAVSSHTKRLNKQWEERLAKATSPAKADDDADDDEPKPEAKPKAEQQPKTGAQSDPYAERFAKFEAESAKRIAKLEAEAKASREAAAKAERARIEEHAYGAVRAALSGKVAAGAEGHALTLLKASNRIHIDESGATRLRGIVKDEPEDGFDIEEGVSAYLKSDEAKFFVPPPTNAGPANAKRSQSFGNAPTGANGSAAPDAVGVFEAQFGPIAKTLL